MLTTEEEAKTKRCHESFPACTQVSPDGMTMAVASFSSSAYAMQTAPSYCIGSACMAWRWHHPHPGATSRDGSHSQSFSVAVGFCGKAGRP